LSFIAQSENTENVEWQDEDDLDLTGMTVPEDDVTAGLPCLFND